MSNPQGVTRTDGIMTGVRFRDLKIIGSTWMRFAFRSGGGVASLFLVMIVGLFIATICISSIETLGEGMGGRGVEQAELVQKISESSFVSNTLTFVLSGTDDEKAAQGDYLVHDRPAMLSLALLFLIYLVPFGVCAAAFNQTAGDIGSRGLRFILSRTERPNIFLGRFLSAFIFVAMAFAILITIVTGYLHFKLGIYPIGDLVLWCFWGILGFVIYALPYVALASWVSCCMRTPFSALAMTLLAAVGSTMVLLIVGLILSAALSEQTWLPKLMPWGWKSELFSGDMTTRLTAYGAMIGFTGLFLLVGLMTFRKRDL